jgi:hypothetical protein
MARPPMHGTVRADHHVTATPLQRLANKYRSLTLLKRTSCYFANPLWHTQNRSSDAVYYVKTDLKAWYIDLTLFKLPGTETGSQPVKLHRIWHHSYGNAPRRVASWQRLDALQHVNSSLATTGCSLRTNVLWHAKSHSHVLSASS